MKLPNILIALAIGFVVILIMVLLAALILLMLLLVAVLDSTVIIEVPTSSAIFELSSYS